MVEKEQITILLSKKLLHELDEFRAGLGLSRSAVFSNAFRIYKLWMENTLISGSAADHDPALKEQLNRIEILVKSLNAEERILEKKMREEIESAPDISVAPNFNEIGDQIVDLLSKVKSISTPTLARLLEIEEGVVFLVCSNLSKNEKIKLNEKYEWEKNDTVPK